MSSNSTDVDMDASAPSLPELERCISNNGSTRGGSVHDLWAGFIFFVTSLRFPRNMQYMGWARVTAN